MIHSDLRKSGKRSCGAKRCKILHHRWMTATIAQTQPTNLKAVTIDVKTCRYE